ncbi:carboxypeptidase-like regulatory domain-containing protein [Hymenobacter oligotrophus]|uniref:Carboxypeptidase-like regulatory domain-containing protein n=1 Tax=Hymenobacter oligotrophus TaxID=2319843 RepID=A0A3B7QZ14_9BACT|nr:carboxypeptidase-like regulatory domain-containing protein [Hymenobacter oligotrophus]AYA36443.1 carboxypeptidase-like regulatory domain-containing protein [Hymenobacter oligotrophus]
MNLRLLATLFLGVLPLMAQGQQEPLEGQVLNAHTGLPVPFATLGVPRRGLGTVADEQGRYLLRLPADFRDTVVVTSVGFTRALLLPAQLASGQRVVRLAPQEQTLANVVVAHRRVKPATLGRKSAKGDVRWVAGSSGKNTVDDEWGWELGAVLHPAKPAVLEQFHVYLHDNNYELLRFRLNLYAYEQGKPGKALLQQDVQLKVWPKQKGWLTVDLRSYHINLAAQPVAATIQWLQSETAEPQKKYFSVPVKREAKQVMLERENSEAAWTIHALQPSLYFELLMEE